MYVYIYMHKRVRAHLGIYGADIGRQIENNQINDYMHLHLALYT